MMRELVSILIPAHNAEPWIADALASVLAQTWQRREVIVVDDGSTDGTADVVQRFENRGVKLIRQAAQGGNVARNRAYAASTGDYIQYLDADDVLGPRKIELQLARLREAPANSIATCAWAHFAGNDPNRAVFAPEPIWRDLSPVDWLVEAHTGGWMMPPHAWLIPRSVAELAGPWAERVMRNQDGEFFARVVLASSGVKFTPDTRVFYRYQAKGWRRAASPDVIEGLLWSIESLEHELRRAEDSVRVRNAVATAYDRIAFDVFPEYASIANRARARAKAVGTSAFRPPAGGIFGFVARGLGWKFARRAQKFSYRLRRTEPVPQGLTPPAPVRSPEPSVPPRAVSMRASLADGSRFTTR